MQPARFLVPAVVVALVAACPGRALATPCFGLEALVLGPILFLTWLVLHAVAATVAGALACLASLWIKIQVVDRRLGRRENHWRAAMCALAEAGCAWLGTGVAWLYGWQVFVGATLLVSVAANGICLARWRPFGKGPAPEDRLSPAWVPVLSVGAPAVFAVTYFGLLWWSQHFLDMRTFPPFS